MDPMCSWCYGFEPQWQRIREQLPGDAAVRYVMGGLAPDSDAPMPQDMQDYVQQVWRSIAARTGVTFNHEFWTRNTPRRSTWPACRAVIAAMRQGQEHGPPMARAIQRAYYLQARNPSDDSTLVALAGEVGLDAERFSAELNDETTRGVLAQHIGWSRSVGVDGFPSLLLEKDGDLYGVARGYTPAEEALERIGRIIGR